MTDRQKNKESKKMAPEKKKLLLIFIVIVIALLLLLLLNHYVMQQQATKQTTIQSETQTAWQPTVSKDALTIATFNIQFLGHFRNRDNHALAQLLKDCDLVVVQELLAPPFKGIFPNGAPFKPDSEARDFFNEMKELGFSWYLSEEDTGSNDKIHTNSSGTEWFVAFYKENVLDIAKDLPNGYIAEDRSNNPDYERVPYAFGFRSDDKKIDFVLISVHLQPGDRKVDMARRKHELASINDWINKQDVEEKDFIILGDMNIKNKQELRTTLPGKLISLNDEARATNTNTRTKKPYDHILINPAYTKEIDTEFDCRIINLIETMEPFWKKGEKYPGKPYDHNKFKTTYSDHHPLVFKLKITEDDD